MSTDYTYDEQGQFFPFFIITITALFTLPTTYSVFRRSQKLESTAPRVTSTFKPAEVDLIDKQRWKQKRRERKLKRMIAAAIGWTVMAWMAYLLVVTQRTVPKVYDPYKVLGIGRSANEKQITKQYRKLSLTQHPDKRRPSAEKNETVQSINDDWVEITKAFKALTDEEIRNNYLQYGHPDGKQSFSIGIALPQFIVTEGNGKYVLLLYGSLLGVLLPLLVGSWWYGTQKTTKEKVLVNSAGQLFQQYNEEMSEGDVLSALVGAVEFADVLSSVTDVASVERAVLDEASGLGLTKEDRDAIQNLSNEQKRQALTLLWAYLGRLKVSDEVVTEAKIGVAPVAFALNESLVAMAPFFGNTKPLLSAYHISQSLLQAVTPGSSPLLQLPHITAEQAKLVDQATGLKNTNIQTLMAIPDAKRRKVLQTLDSSQYDSAMQVASQLPLARVEKAFFKVVGERYITPGSLIQFVIKIRIIPPGFSPIPPVNPADLEDIDPKEGDIDALTGRSGKRQSADGQSGSADGDPIQPPLAHTPFFPRDHSPRWRVFLADGKAGKIGVPPFTFSTFDKPVFTYHDDGAGGTRATPTCNVQTLKCSFQAPAQAATYLFNMHLVCDSYVGFDSTQEVEMKIDEMSKAEEVESDGEISEPDDDSVAAQVAALKGGAARPRKRKVPQTADDISSGSDTEGDDGSDSSDTDTDTDTEDES